MANKRIKDLGTTASTLAADDYVAIDGNANGTRKIVKGDLVNDISTQVAGTYLDEANNLSDVASKDTSKLNLEVPDVGSSPNEVSLNGQLGSMAFQDSAGVSVGQLEADGGITATSDGNNTQLKLERTSSATGEFEIYTNTNKLYFKNVGDGNTYPLTLDGSKAGIGTVSPDRALHCYSSSVATVLKLDSAGADTGLEFAHSDTVAAGINCSTGGDLEFRTGANSSANQRAVIDSSGRLGVNQSTPGNFNAAADDLVVGDSSGNRGITVSSGDASTGNLFFGDATSGSIARGAVSYDHSTNALSLTTSAATAVTIDSSGRLGVGIDSPDKALTVKSGTINTDVARFTGANDDRGLVLSTAANGITNDATVEYDAVSASTAGQHVFKTDGTTRATIDSSGNMTLHTGSLTIGTAGKGIYFGATTDAAGMTAELLDDYEVGSWDPVFGVSSGSFTTMTMDVLSARYVKVGHLVYFQCYIRTNNVNTTGTGGQLIVSGLPYANAGSNNFAACYVGYAQDWATAPAAGYVVTGGSFIYLTKRVTGINGDLTEMVAGDMTTGAVASENQLMISGSYCSF